MKEKESRFFKGDKVWYNATPYLKYEGIVDQVADEEYVIRYADGICVTDSDFTKLSRRDESISRKNIDSFVEKSEMILQKREEAEKKLRDTILQSNMIIPNTHPIKSDAVNSPKYYNRYSVEVVEMARRIWGDEAMKTAAEITAFIYRMRAGIKPDNPWEQDIGKEEWWLNYRAKI